MPISKRGDKWYWGSKGPFDSRKKAEEVEKAAINDNKIQKYIQNKNIKKVIFVPEKIINIVI